MRSMQVSSQAGATAAARAGPGITHRRNCLSLGDAGVGEAPDKRALAGGRCSASEAPSRSADAAAAALSDAVAEDRNLCIV
jgi:hypothetical protein